MEIVLVENLPSFYAVEIVSHAISPGQVLEWFENRPT